MGSWPTRPLADLVDRVTEKNIESLDRVFSVSAQDGLVPQEQYFNKRVASKNLDGYWVVRPGDYVFNKSYSDGYPLGAVVRNKSHEPGVVSPLYIVMRRADAGLAEGWLDLAFHSRTYAQSLQGLMKEGGRAHGALNVKLSDYFTAQLPVPDIAIQRRIVDLIAHVDRHLANLRAERGSLEDLGSALREEHPFGDEMVLGDVIRGIRGGKSPLTDGERPSLEEDGVLKVSAVTPRRFVAEESKRLSAGHGLAKEIEVRPGDILITRANTPERVGAVCRVPDSVRTGLYLCDKTLRLDVDSSRVDPDYLVEVLNTRVARQHLTSAATGTSKSMFNISQDKIRSTPIVVPDRSSQTAYARRLSDQAALLSSLDQELRTLTRARQSLIADLLSGVVRIPAAYDVLLDEVA